MDNPATAMSSGSSSDSASGSDSCSDSTQNRTVFDDYVQIFESFEQAEKALVEEDGRDSSDFVDYHCCVNSYDEGPFSEEFGWVSTSGRIRLRTALSHQYAIVAMALFSHMYDGSAISILDQMSNIWECVNGYEDRIEDLERTAAKHGDVRRDQVRAIVRRTLALKKLRGDSALKDCHIQVYDRKQFKHRIPEAVAERYYPKDKCYTLGDLKEWAKMLAKESAKERAKERAKILAKVKAKERAKAKAKERAKERAKAKAKKRAKERAMK
jgi:hypothetical protein